MGRHLKKLDDRRNLAQELAGNRTEALEILREALSNAKDHKAERVWIRTTKDPRNNVTLLVADDGEGMTDERFSAFMGIGSTRKTEASVIGYKGHGSKLYLECRQMFVATRTDPSHPWSYTEELEPLRNAERATFEVHELGADHKLRQVIEEVGLAHSKGTVILLEELACHDSGTLLQRRRIESYCDWFTVLGDIRSGLFDARSEFHQILLTGDADKLGLMRAFESKLRPLDVRLRINGEREYTAIAASASTREFLGAWPLDVEKFPPHIAAFGHRFSDTAKSSAGSYRGIVDDASAIRLTGIDDWYTEGGIGVVAHVEGNRRQLLTYREASNQEHNGLYSFKERWGLWLCKDFIPVAQRNDLLEKALDRSAPRLQFEFKNLRNWKVFVNDQSLKLTANRNDVANQSQREGQIVDALVGVLSHAIKGAAFRTFVEKLQAAKHARSKEREIAHAEGRLEAAKKWIEKKNRKSLDLMNVSNLQPYPRGHSLAMKIPESEQELLLLYGVLSGRYMLPIQIFGYDAHEGVDAIGFLSEPRLLEDQRPLVRVEFKFEVEPGRPIDHFFEAIDVLICWKVGATGLIFEVNSATTGHIKKRKPVLKSRLDTHEIVYESGDSERRIPVLELSILFDLRSR